MFQKVVKVDSLIDITHQYTATQNDMFPTPVASTQIYLTKILSDMLTYIIGSIFNLNLK